MPDHAPLVSTAWLAERLGDATIAILEVANTRDLPVDGHIPGAHAVFWKDFCWDDSDRQFPAPETMAERLGSLGIRDDQTIAVVGEPIQYGTYAYWVLAMAGQEHRMVLVDGGRPKWLDEGRPTSEPTRSQPQVALPGAADESSRIGRDGVRARLGDNDLLLLDVRTPEEYAGERVSPPWFELDYGAERLGRIPGAQHLYYQELLDDQEAFLPIEELEQRVAGFPIGESETVVYCRLSHRATLMWFALTRLLGRDRVQVYDGSWTEWGTIVGFPIER